MKIQLNQASINDFNQRIASVPVGYGTLANYVIVKEPTAQDPAGTFRYNQGRLEIYLSEGMSFLTVSVPLYFDYCTFGSSSFTFEYDRGLTGFFGTGLWSCTTSSFFSVHHESAQKVEIPKRAVYGLMDFIALDFTYRNDGEYERSYSLSATVVINEQIVTDPSGPYSLFLPEQMHSLSLLASPDKTAHLYPVGPTYDDIQADDLLDYVIGRVQEGTNFCVVTPCFDESDALALLANKHVQLHNPVGDAISVGTFGQLCKEGAIQF